MKKLLMSMLVALGCVIGTTAAEKQYKVYDVKMSLKTTKAGGTTTSSSCDDSYTYRVKSNRKISGVIAGCGCEAVIGDPTCVNFEIYFWDETTKTQLTNFTYSTEVLQRIDKSGKTVEHVVTFVVTDQDGELFDLTLAGFGSYKASKTDAKYDTLSVSGGVTGFMDAPYKVTPGSCTACSSTPDLVEQSQAMAVCEDGLCTESNMSNVTPVYGTYTMKYNSTKAKKCEKNGVNASTLGLPSYVSL